jgi:hypothetical protein
MKAIKMTVLAAAMVVAGVGVTKAQSVDEIMTKHEKAVGGMDNWDKMKTLKMVGSLSQQGMEINMTQTYMMEKAMRMDISVMGMSGFTIVTTTGGWSYMPFGGGTKLDTMKPDMVKTMQGQMNIKSMQMLDYKAKGTKLELAGKDTINSAPCYKIKCTNKDGENSFCFIDMNTYYLTRIERTVKADDQEQEVAVAFANYQKQPEGVVMPMSMTAQGVEITYKTIEINKPVDEQIFIPKMDK